MGARKEGMLGLSIAKKCDFDLHPDCALKHKAFDENEKWETQEGVLKIGTGTMV